MDDPNDNPYVQASNGTTPKPAPDSPEAAGIATDSVAASVHHGFGATQHEGQVRTSRGKGKRS